MGFRMEEEDSPLLHTSIFLSSFLNPGNRKSRGGRQAKAGATATTTLLHEVNTSVSLMEREQGI